MDGNKKEKRKKKNSKFLTRAHDKWHLRPPTLELLEGLKILFSFEGTAFIVEGESRNAIGCR